MTEMERLQDRKGNIWNHGRITVCIPVAHRPIQEIGPGYGDDDKDDEFNWIHDESEMLGEWPPGGKMQLSSTWETPKNVSLKKWQLYFFTKQRIQMLEVQGCCSRLSLAPQFCSHGHKMAAQPLTSHPQSKWNKKEGNDKSYLPAVIYFYQENHGFPWSSILWYSMSSELCVPATLTAPNRQSLTQQSLTVHSSFTRRTLCEGTGRGSKKEKIRMTTTIHMQLNGLSPVPITLLTSITHHLPLFTYSIILFL